MSKTYLDPYAVLGLARTATPAEIKKAYFALVRQYPPEQEPVAFKRIRVAYEQLRVPKKRLEVDMGLVTKWPAPTRPPSWPEIDFSIQPEDVVAIFKAGTDLEQIDFREDFREVKW